MSVGGELSLPDEECGGFQSQAKDKSLLDTRAQKTGLKQKGEGFASVGASSPRAQLESRSAPPDRG